MNTFMFWTMKSIRTYEGKHYYLSNTRTMDRTFEENKSVAFHHRKNANKFLQENAELMDRYIIVLMEYSTETNELPNYADKK